MLASPLRRLFKVVTSAIFLSLPLLLWPERRVFLARLGTPLENTKLTEKLNLQFRAEAFNAANHLIMGDPDTNFGTPQFGQITSTRFDNRELQFALRLQF